MNYKTLPNCLNHFQEKTFAFNCFFPFKSHKIGNYFIQLCKFTSKMSQKLYLILKKIIFFNNKMTTKMKSVLYCYHFYLDAITI